MVRGCALRFGDDDDVGRLDLFLNTGTAPVFYNVWSFMQFASARMKMKHDDWSGQEALCRDLPAALTGAIEAIRWGLSSFADVSYYTKMPLRFAAHDGVLRYIKFRLIRPVSELESGLPTLAQQRRIWDQRREPGDDRPADYLREEFARRVDGEGVTYALQYQLRAWDADTDTAEFFNPCRHWDEAVWPFEELGEVKLYKALEPAW